MPAIAQVDKRGKLYTIIARADLERDIPTLFKSLVSEKPPSQNC
jgi:hypothetical protein